MGLISGLVQLPLAPVRGVGWTVQHLLDAAEREQLQALRSEWARLSDDLEAGLVDEDEFDAREDEVLDALEELGAGPG